MTADTVTLWRAAPADQLTFGQASWWTPEVEHARRYTRMPGFGGPVIYRTEVKPKRVLDLRVEPWHVLADEFGVDREDYPEPREIDHEVIWSLSRMLAAAGRFEWAILAVMHPDGQHEEWLYLGSMPIPAYREVAP